MASVDGSKSIQGASDELFDNTCGPCKEDSIEKSANQYCVDCGVYLCNQCKDFHRKLPLSKNHKVIFDSYNIAAKSSVSQESGPVFYCSCSTNKVVEFYCDDHEYVMCRPCRSIKHHKCKTVSVQEKSSSYTTVMLNSVLSKTKSIKNKFDKMKKESHEAVKESKLLKEACRKEIQKFRSDLNTFLDRLEQDLLKDLDTYQNEQERRTNQLITTLTAALQLLDSDYTLLENAKQDGRKTSMFTSDLQVSKRLQDYESRLEDLEKDFIRPALSFEKNQKLAEIQTTIKALGHLREKAGTAILKKRLLLGRKIQTQSEVNVKLANDRLTPRISGCTVLSSGHIVLCDRNNSKIKLLNTTSELQGSLTLPDYPSDVSVIDGNNVIVTLPWKMQLQYIQVLPQMKAGRVIQLDKKCWGVEVSGDKIYTTCHDNPGKGEVRILDLDGNIKRRVGVKENGSFMFMLPYCITVGPSGKIYVSDSHKVTCIAGDEEMTLADDEGIIYQYDIGSPCRLSVDDEDHVLVVMSEYSSAYVHVITADGRQHVAIPSSTGLPSSPYSVAYRDSDDTLVVGFYNHDKVLLFQLSK